MPRAKRLTFGEAVRRIRKARGMSLREAAASMHGIGVSPLSWATIRDIENGSGPNPRMGSLLALCAALDMRVVIEPTGVTVEDMDDVRQRT